MQPEIKDELGRKMPFSLQAEQSLLASVLINPGCLDDVLSIISSEDFYVEDHKQIFEVMNMMFIDDKNIDVVTLIERLSKEGIRNEAEIRNYLTTIASDVPSVANVKDYAKIIKSKSTLRKLIEAGDSISDAAYVGEDDADDIVEFAENKIYSISDTNVKSNLVHLKSIIPEVYRHFEELRSNPDISRGIDTGFRDIDRKLLGMGKGNLIIVGARPGMGKTSIALNIAESVAEKSGKAVCIFSLEMPSNELVTRLFASDAQVDSMKLRSGELSNDDWNRLAFTANKLAKLPIYIDDSTDTSVSKMRSLMRRMKVEVGLVVVDYLQLMKSDKKKIENRVQEIADISRNLKSFAKDMGVPVLACAQLSRETDKNSKGGRKPQLSDLKDSGQIEQDADVVILLNSDDDSEGGDENNNYRSFELIIAKNRHGETGTVKVGYLREYTRFTNLEHNY